MAILTNGDDEMIVDWYSSDDDAMPQTYITQLSLLTSTNQFDSRLLNIQC